MGKLVGLNIVSPGCYLLVEIYCFERNGLNKDLELMLSGHWETRLPLCDGRMPWNHTDKTVSLVHGNDPNHF
jgi:hypothetical protein